MGRVGSPPAVPSGASVLPEPGCPRVRAPLALGLGTELVRASVQLGASSGSLVEF